MGDTHPTSKGPFNDDERATLHSLAEMFSDKDDRDELRRLVHEGATLHELLLAYKTNRRVISSLKTIGGLIVLVGGVVAALKGLNLWPK